MLSLSTFAQSITFNKIQMQGEKQTPLFREAMKGCTQEKASLTGKLKIPFRLRRIKRKEVYLPFN